MAGVSKKDYLLRFIRIAKGISKEKIAVTIESPVHNIWRAEVGRVVSERIALGIAKVLGIDPDIMFYNMGLFPPDKIDFVKKDPLFFKDLIDEACAEPWRLTKSKEYMENLKSTLQSIQKNEEPNINPEIKKILNQISPK
jgi:transcriptional regulator with XRE-family HTH domain